jgi:hypothetical protein
MPDRHDAVPSGVHVHERHVAAHNVPVVALVATLTVAAVAVAIWAGPLAIAAAVAAAGGLLTWAVARTAYSELAPGRIVTERTLRGRRRSTTVGRSDTVVRFSRRGSLGVVHVTLHPDGDAYGPQITGLPSPGGIVRPLRILATAAATGLWPARTSVHLQLGVVRPAARRAIVTLEQHGVTVRRAGQPGPDGHGPA